MPDTPFNTPQYAKSTREGYVLSSGEVTKDRARAEQDVREIKSRGGFVSSGGGTSAAPVSEGIPQPSRPTIQQPIINRNIIQPFRTPGGEIRAQGFGTRTRESVGGFFSGFVSPFTRPGETFERTTDIQGQIIPRSKSEQLGRALSVPVLTVGTGILGGTAAAQNVVSTGIETGGGLLKRGGEAVKKKAQEVTLKSLAKDIITIPIVGTATTEISQNILDTTTLNKETKNILNYVPVEDIQRKASESERSKLAGQPFYKNLIYDINPGLSSEKSTYGATVLNELNNLGLSEKEKDMAFKGIIRLRSNKNIAEAVGMATTGAESEKFGRKYISYNFEQAGKRGLITSIEKSPWEIFKRIGTPLALAGASEGATVVLISQRQRDQDFNLKDIGLGASFGTLSATSIGGVIGGFSVKSPKISKTTEFVSNVLDPFEYPGDQLATIEQKAGKRFFNMDYKEPSVFVYEPAKKPRGSVSFSGVNTKTSPTVIFPTNLVGSAKPRVPSLTNTFIDINTNPNVPISTNPNVPISTNINIPTNTNINLPTFVNVPVPVSTPFPRLFPPIPLGFGSGGAGKGYGKKEMSLFTNELQAGLGLLTGGVYGMGAELPKRKSKRRKK